MVLAEAEILMPSRRTDTGIRMGNALEAIRKEHGFTQQQLADRLGLSLPGYLGYRRGYTLVTRNTLPKWAKALEESPATLARRLEIDWLDEPGSSELRRELAALLPDSSAAELDRYVRDLATLPLVDQKQIIDGLGDHVLGRKARRGLT